MSLRRSAGYDRQSSHKLAFLFLFLYPAMLCSQGGDDDAALVQFTRPQLQTAIGLTKHENTRLQGLHELVRMAGPRLYVGSMVFGDPEHPELTPLRGEAAKAAAACRDVPTVEKALDSPMNSLRLWAVMSFPLSTQAGDTWRPLVPKLVKRLSDPDAGVRLYVVDKLWGWPEGARAIARHAPEETDPDVLLRIARSGSSPEFYRSLVRLLSSTDAKVRESALFFVYLNLSNEYTAPMWKLGFNQEVYERVRKLSHSSSQQERESAMKALNQLDLLKQGISR